MRPEQSELNYHLDDFAYLTQMHCPTPFHHPTLPSQCSQEQQVESAFLVAVSGSSTIHFRTNGNSDLLRLMWPIFIHRMYQSKHKLGLICYIQFIFCFKFYYFIAYFYGINVYINTLFNTDLSINIFFLFLSFYQDNNRLLIFKFSFYFNNNVNFYRHDCFHLNCFL